MYLTHGKHYLVTFNADAYAVGAPWHNLDPKHCDIDEVDPYHAKCSTYKTFTT
jgi:hypothetical protein